MSLYNQLSDSSFLKKLLIGIDEELVERFLQTKKNYETSKDKEDKKIYRDKLINMFWELYIQVVRMINPELSTAKRLFLRYGLTDLRNLSPEDQKFMLTQPTGKVDYENETIFYVDEWLQGIVDGKIKPSAGDETGAAAPVTQLSSQQISTRQEKYISILKIEQERFINFKDARSELINQLEKSIEILRESHQTKELPYEGVYSPEQVRAVDDLSDIQKEIRKLNKEIIGSARTMLKSQHSLDDIRKEEGSIGNIVAPVDLNKEKAVSEVANIRQMVKMTVGRQGNPFPFLSSGFMPKETKQYLFKDVVKKKMNQWLSLDPEAFHRTYKGNVMNIAPYIILVPGYGLTGACWEPLDMDNKQFGRGRITMPIFTRTPDLTLLTAMGDIRWQAAKETASYYWMEEGLTGRYYEYYIGAKLKGDLRTLFITDYLLWMTKETQGVQKLEQDARYVFWRYVPLPDEHKVTLSGKGYYYNQLWEKEQVWRRSKEKD